MMDDDSSHTCASLHTCAVNYYKYSNSWIHFAWEQKSVHVSLGICKSKNALGDKEIVQGFATFIYFKGSIYFFVHLAKPKSHALS